MMKRASGLAMLLAASAHATEPAFDCRNATSLAEKTICKSPALSALDARIAGLYANQLKQLSPAAARVLRQDQQRFIHVRDTQFELYAEDPQYTMSTPKDVLENRLAQLADIRSNAPADYTGTWSNLEGAWWIVRLSDGRYRIVADAVDAVNARGICHLSGIAKATTHGLEIGGGDDSDVYHLRRDGAVLRVAVADDRHDAGSERACGIATTLIGDYLPTREDPAAAIKSQSGD